MTSLVLLEKSEGIATLTLNRPGVMNALSLQLMNAVADAFEDLAADSETGVVILTGAGRAFCAGLDLKELGTKNPALDDDSGLSQVTAAIFRKIYGFDRPIIGAINGPAVAGGFELALMCDILYASTQARFADTHARVGFIPGGGLSQILPRIIGPGRAKEISFTGNYLSAEQAEKWGLVNRVLPPDELMPACRALAKDILSCVPEVIKGYKRLIDQGLNTTLAQGLCMETDAFLEHARQVSAESIAGRRQAVIKRGRSRKDHK